MVKYLCLVYSNQNKDSVDPKNANKGIKIDGDRIKKCNKVTCKVVTSYLINVVNSGAYIWRFMCNRVSQFDAIGIRKVLNVECEKSNLGTVSMFLKIISALDMRYYPESEINRLW